MATEIKYNITADEKKAVSSLKKVGDAATDVSKTAAGGFSMSSGAATGLAVALAGVYSAYKLVNAAIDIGIGLSKRALTESISYINTETKLSAVLRATGNAAGFTTDQLTALASAYQNVTTFSDDAVISAQTILATFKNITGKTFTDATKAAMDLSSVLGGDLSDAAMKVGKALTAPAEGLGALTKAGIKFREEEKLSLELMIEMGRTLDAQQYILSKIESSYKGVAEALGKTFGGKVTQLENAFSDLLKELGFIITKNQFFIGVVDILTNAFRNLSQYIQDNRLQLMKLAKEGFMGIINMFPPIIKGFGIIIETVNILYIVINNFVIMVKEIALALAYLIRGVLLPLDLVGKAFEKLGKENPFKGLLDQLDEGLKLQAQDVWESALGSGKAAVKIGSYITESQKLADVIQEVVDNINKLDVSITNLPEIPYNERELPKEPKDITGGRSKEQLQDMLNQIKKDKEDVIKYAREAQESLMIPTPLELALMNPQTNIDKMNKERIETNKITTRELLSLDIQYYRARGDLAKADLTELEVWYSEQKDKYAEFSEERIKIDQIYSEKFKQLTQTWIQDIRQVGDAIQQSLTDNITEFLMGTKSAGDAFRDLIALMARELFKVSMTRMFSGMASETGGGFGNFLVSALGGLLGRAEGGDVNAGQPYLVGEKGRPELFVPRSSGTIVANNGGGGIVINSPITVNNTGGGKGADENEVNKIGQAYKTMLRNAVKEVLIDEQRPRGLFNRGYA